MGAFDAGVGAAVIANGYDRTFEELRPPAPTLTATPPRAQAHVRGSRVTLGPEGQLDLGGIVKGWTVDRVAQQLRDTGCTRLLVDGGGDIRAWRAAGDEWLVGVADGRAVGLTDGAVATSSTERRRWRDTAGGQQHHVVEQWCYLGTSALVGGATLFRALVAIGSRGRRARTHAIERHDAHLAA